VLLTLLISTRAEGTIRSFRSEQKGCMDEVRGKDVSQALVGSNTSKAIRYHVD